MATAAASPEVSEHAAKRSRLLLVLQIVALVIGMLEARHRFADERAELGVARHASTSENLCNVLRQIGFHDLRLGLSFQVDMDLDFSFHAYKARTPLRETRGLYGAGLSWESGIRWNEDWGSWGARTARDFRG